MHGVLESARFVAGESRSVSIGRSAVARFAGRLVEGPAEPLPWDGTCHFTGPPELVTAYLLVLDTINFCFWSMPGEEAWETEIGGTRVSGYNGLAAALKMALESGEPLADAGFLTGLSPERLHGLIGGRGRLQLMEERALALRELGAVLLRDYEGKAYRLVEAAGGRAWSLVELLVKKLASYRDKAVYLGREVHFYKRAQILAADLYGALQGKGFGAFRDMDLLTAFADYKLPQVLRQTGVLVYETELARLVDSRTILAAGCAEEVEIRANTVVAVEMIRQAASESGCRLRPFEIDGILWQMGQEDKYRSLPYHRTKTVFY